MSALLSTITALVKSILKDYTVLGQPFGKGAYGWVIPVDAAKIGNDITQAYVDAQIDLWLADIANHFGGFTTLTSGFGGWTNHDGALIKEDVILVLVFADNPTFDQVCYVETMGKRIRHLFYQDCVTTFIAGHAILIDKSR